MEIEDFDENNFTGKQIKIAKNKKNGYGLHNK